METRDLIVTPLLIMVVYAIAYIIRPYATDSINRVYFFPALTVKITGALALGFIYQFYYNGGDTFNYHTHGSRIIWETFIDSPEKAMQLFFNNGTHFQGIYKYSSKIAFFGDPGSYAIVRLSFIFDIFTFSSYSATAVLFAIFCFIGMWMFFLTFYEQYPHLHKPLAIASFFIPSVFFWGSGLLKDTVTLGCLGIAVFLVFRLFIEHRFSVRYVIFLILALYGLYLIKIYILLTFLPAAILWIFLVHFSKIHSVVLRLLLFPITLSIALSLGAYAVLKAGEGNAKYSVTNIGATAQVTAYDIRYYTGKDAGSGYSIGDLDGSVGSMIWLAPQAMNVSLFRPYLWEVNNPLMALSALESFILLVAVVYLLFRCNIRIVGALLKPNILFLLIFAMVFAFGVGVSTFNFGTLVRYKIPMLPFFVIALILIYDYSKRLRNAGVFDETE